MSIYTKDARRAALHDHGLVNSGAYFLRVRRVDRHSNAGQVMCRSRSMSSWTRGSEYDQWQDWDCDVPGLLRSFLALAVSFCVPVTVSFRLAPTLRQRQVRPAAKRSATIAIRLSAAGLGGTVNYVRCQVIALCPQQLNMNAKPDRSG
jgi:hypothetical protein